MFAIIRNIDKSLPSDLPANIFVYGEFHTHQHVFFILITLIVVDIFCQDFPTHIPDKDDQDLYIFDQFVCINCYYILNLSSTSVED